MAFNAKINLYLSLPQIYKLYVSVMTKRSFIRHGLYVLEIRYLNESIHWCWNLYEIDKDKFSRLNQCDTIMRCIFIKTIYSQTIITIIINTSVEVSLIWFVATKTTVELCCRHFSTFTTFPASNEMIN